MLYLSVFAGLRYEIFHSVREEHGCLELIFPPIIVLSLFYSMYYMYVVQRWGRLCWVQYFEKYCRVIFLISLI